MRIYKLPGGLRCEKDELDFFAEAFMDNETPFSNMDWAAPSQNTTIACQIEL